MFLLSNNKQRQVKPCALGPLPFERQISNQFVGCVEIFIADMCQQSCNCYARYCGRKVPIAAKCLDQAALTFAALQEENWQLRQQLQQSEAMLDASRKREEIAIQQFAYMQSEIQALQAANSAQHQLPGKVS